MSASDLFVYFMAIIGVALLAYVFIDVMVQLDRDLNEENDHE